MNLASTLPLADWGMHDGAWGAGWMLVMMPMMLLFWGAIAFGAIWLIRGGARTPCEEWDARALVGHVVDSSYLFLGFIGRKPEPTATVDDDPVAAFVEARDAVQAALDDPEVARTEYDGMFGKAVFDDRWISWE